MSDKLLGDRIADGLEKIGADKLAKRYEQVTGRDCGCNKRRNAINEFHQKVRNMGGAKSEPVNSADAAYRQRLLEKGNGAG